MALRRVLTVVAAALAAATLSGLPAAHAASGSAPARASETDDRGPGWPPSAVPAAGTFYPTAPLRVLGTETAGSAVTPGAPVPVPVLGHAGLPVSGVSAVVVNATVTAGPSDSGLTLSEAGAAPPGPVVAAPAAGTRSGLVTVPLTSGSLVAGATTGPLTATVDVVGYYAADDTVVASSGSSGGYQPMVSSRIYDSRTHQPLPAGGRQELSVDLGPTAGPHVTALLLRATATGVTPGALSVTGAGLPASAVSSPAVSFGAGSADNLVVVPAAGRGGTAANPGSTSVEVVMSSTSASPAEVQLDLVGFYDDGALGPNLRYRPLTQTRVVNSTAGLGSALVTGVPDHVALGDAVVTDSTFGLTGVLTTNPAVPSGLAVAADDPATAPSFLVPVGVGSVSVQPEVSAGRTVGLVTTGGSASLDLTLDVTGTFEAYPPVTNPAARSWVPAVAPWQVSTTLR